MDAIPHLALPLRVNANGYEAVEQDTLDELITNVRVICSFPLGYRIEAPEFGIPEYELSDLPLPTDGLEQTIETWEPRADVEISQTPYDPADPTAAGLQIRVTMPAAEED